MRLAATRGPAVQRFRSLSLTSLLSADEPQMLRFVAEELGDLATDDDATSRLRATLLVYFEERSSAAKTGRRLAIHTNSVHYRVRRCAELIGHPVHERRGELETALRLKQTLALTEQSTNV
jgi:DNA-binding PucR family transcriptional regulator